METATAAQQKKTAPIELLNAIGAAIKEQPQNFSSDQLQHYFIEAQIDAMQDLRHAGIIRPTDEQIAELHLLYLRQDLINLSDDNYYIKAWYCTRFEIFDEDQKFFEGLNK